MRAYSVIVFSVALTVSPSTFAHLALPSPGLSPQIGHFFGHLLVTTLVALMCLIIVRVWRRAQRR